MLAAAASAATVSGVDSLLACSPPRGRSVNDRLGVAVMGARGRGKSHLAFFASRRDTRVLYVCDVDSMVGSLRAEQVARKQGGVAPTWVSDIRLALSDPRVDIVSIATPNHWHALAAVWAMQAGKDVYVEYPVSHNVQEGRCMVAAARRYQRVCQSGFQSRSNPGMISAIDFVRCGGVGTVRLARGICFKRARAPEPAGVYPIPSHVNYDLWLGPAPAAPVTRQRFHYDWRWQWPYGNGSLGSQTAHQLDICRWGLQAHSIGDVAVSFGAALGHHNTVDPSHGQVSVHQFGDKSIVTETRGTPVRPFRGLHVGVIFEGTDGYVVMTSYHSGTAFDRDGRAVRHFRGGGGTAPHLVNFLNAVRRRSCHELNCDIEEGHLSSALAHTANISYQLGHDVTLEAARSQAANLDVADDVLQSLERMQVHLREHGVDSDAAALRFGKKLECDPIAETFCDDQRANYMLTRRYRRPFIVPAAGSV